MDWEIDKLELDCEKEPDKIEIGIGVMYNMLKAIYCHQKGDAVAANSYAVNAHEFYEKLDLELN